MAENKPKARRIIGIDFGLARIGISYSDESFIIAMTLMTLKAEKKTESTLAKLLQELKLHQEKYKYEILEIVVGLPLMMSGRVGFLADEVKHFIELLKRSTAIPIISWDERLTTVQAERSLRETSLSRKRRSQVVDTVAAVIILQSYLDYKQNLSAQGKTDSFLLS
jgi:putative Holliday junction resolvase